MESHFKGRPASGFEQHTAASAEDGQRFTPVSIPLICVPESAVFANDSEWIRLAGAAFYGWATHMDKVSHLHGAVWFAADARGRWLYVSSGGSKNDPEEPPREHKWLQERASHFAASKSSFSDAEVRNGERLVMAALCAEDGKAAIVVGWWWPFGSESALGDGQALYHMAAGFPPYLCFEKEKASAVRLSQVQLQSEREARKKELLFHMANELYSKIDTDEILSEIIRRIREFYPDTQIDLLMTQDQHNSSLEVKPLSFVQMEEDSCTKAFMEGRIVIDRGPKPEEYEMAVPISGKQGIYGVLHIHSHTGPFDYSDIQIMKTLSSAAGSAFENAKLYEQSNVLVNELRLINQLTKRLNQSLKASEIFHFASQELTSIFHADYCCILQMNKVKSEFAVQATNVPSLLNEVLGSDYGYAGMVTKSKEPVIVSDYWANAAIPSKLMQETGARSLIAAPLIVQDEALGVILVAHRVPGFFSYDNYKLLQVLAGHIGLALANASLHAEVRRMVITDNLTGLYARHYLDEQVGLNQKKDFCGSLIVVDIDHFKSVNDTYGHQVGDKILIQVSRIIRSSIRDSDIAARWGGEELAVYLPQVTNAQALQIAERIRVRVEKETDPSVTVSCGISEWNWQDEKISVETLFYRSDMALYKAKNEGRNRVMVG